MELFYTYRGSSGIWVPQHLIIVPEKNLEKLDGKLLDYGEDIVRKFDEHIDGEKPEVANAYLFASAVHNNHKRDNGEPFINHLIGVYNTLKHDFGADPITRAAGLLHDTVEDTFVDLRMINLLFGPEIGFLVDGMTKPPKTSPFQEGHMRYRKKFEAYAKKDNRLILVRLADRIDNLRTLDCFRRTKRERIANETQEFYLPYSLGTPIHDELASLTNFYLRH